MYNVQSGKNERQDFAVGNLAEVADCLHLNGWLRMEWNSQLHYQIDEAEIRYRKY